MTKTIMFVCTSCGAKEGKISKGRGALLLPLLQKELQNDDNIEVRPVGCLSNCDRGVSVALSASGKFGWLFGERGETHDDVQTLANAARAHVKTPDGFIAKPERAKPVVARIPPQDFFAE